MAYANENRKQKLNISIKIPLVVRNRDLNVKFIFYNRKHQNCILETTEIAVNPTGSPRPVHFLRVSEIFIKNMVSSSCITLVRRELLELGLPVKEVELGLVRLESPEIVDLESIRKVLQPYGFILTSNKEEKISEQVKHRLLEYFVKHSTKLNVSDYLVSETGYSYTYLSKVFSKQENITIARYFILIKIEKVKELLTYGELTLREIAESLQYSSVQALSNQFRKVTGYSVSQFREGLAGKRGKIDQIVNLDAGASNLSVEES